LYLRHTLIYQEQETVSASLNCN